MKNRSRENEKRVDTLVSSYDEVRKDLIDSGEGEIEENIQLKATSPNILIKFKDLTVAALIDTGSDVTAINEQLFGRIKGEDVPVLPISNVTVFTATSTRTKRIKWQTLIEIKVGELLVPTVFLVIPRLNVPILLGTNWLNQYAANISYDNNFLSITVHNVSQNIPFVSITGASRDHEHSLQLKTKVNYNVEHNVLSTELRECEYPIENENRLGSSEITPQQHNQLIQLLDQYREVFSENPGQVKNFKCHLEVVPHEPFMKKSYPVPYAKREEVQREIERMLDLGIISRSASPYSSPLTVVTKKDGRVRLCLDARAINKILIPDREQPPPIEDTLYKFKGAKFFSSIDITMGYWNIPLDFESKKYTAFLFRGHSYEFNVLPFGLSVSVGTFVKCMSEVLGNDVDEFAVTYVDDILIWSKDFDSHIRHIGIILEKIEKANMKINFKKSCFLTSQIKYLGHIVSSEGIRMDEDKITVIRNFPEPQKRKDLQSFLGFINFYRKFAKQCSEKIAPLTHLLRKNQPWEWGENEKRIFQDIKNTFVSSIILRHPNFDKVFYLGTDGTTVAVSAYLYQLDEEGEHMPIAFASRNLRGAELRYTITEIELLALIFGCQKFRNYIIGHKLIVKTDHKALSFLQSCKHLTNRLLRWTIALQEYNLKIEYIEGKNNTIPDILSRYPPTRMGSEEMSQTWNLNVIAVENVDSKLTTKLRIIDTLQKEDPRLKYVFEALEIGSEETKAKLSKYYLIYNDILFQRKVEGSDAWKLCVPESLVDILIDGYHALYGHFGPNKILKTLSSTCIFVNMDRRIRARLKTCDLCQKSKCLNHSMEGEMKNVLVQGPRELLSVDLVGPLPSGKGGVNTIFVVLDVFSKFVKLYAIKKANTRTLLHKVKNDYFVKIGKPKAILSDHGSQFSSERWKTELKKEGIQVKYSAVFHPQSNMVERANREIGRLLRCYCHENHKRWCEYLDNIEEWINCTTHESTNYTPYQVMFGKRPVQIIEKLLNFPPKEDENLERIIQIAGENLQRKAERRKARHDQKKLVKFKVNDMVLIRTHYQSSALRKEIRKLFLLFEGPYRVKSIVGPNAYLLEYPDGSRIKGTYNVGTLKPYYAVKNLMNEAEKENEIRENLNQTI